MALNLSVAVRNARLDTIETTISTAAKLRIFSGAKPTACSDADPSGQLVEIALPSDWLNAAGAGAKTLLGTWSATAGAAGSAASFRIKDTAGTTCHIQGTVTATGGGGDLTLDNISIANGQTVTINTFTITDGNA